MSLRRVRKPAPFCSMEIARAVRAYAAALAEKERGMPEMSEKLIAGEEVCVAPLSIDSDG